MLERQHPTTLFRLPGLACRRLQLGMTNVFKCGKTAVTVCCQMTQ